ncbi:MAG: Fe-S cluster assembly protein SufD [Candidatus Omnitrophica bacterium]|nr:Fe-S cluster assembly protein SufD [Candidatus Omnitrophota bacterium]
MPEQFTAHVIDQIAAQLHEPTWMTQLRRQALTLHGELPWPHASDDIWRRTDVSLLDPSQGFVPTQSALLQSITLTESQCAALTQPLGGEHLLVRANGAWLLHEPLAGVVVEELTHVAQTTPDPIRHAIEADGLTPAEQKLTSLNAAFHHDDLAIQIPAGTSVSWPLRIIHAFSASAKQAVFPMTVITVGAGSSVTLIDEYVSVSHAAGEAPHLINGRIELVLEPNAQVHYVRLQRWDAQAREFLLQRATVAQGAALTMANINLGAALSKAHVITKLTGQDASTKLYGFVFGHDHQHIDQHTLQDHQAAHTTSDLQLRAALQDHSRMIYTGLIRIAKEAQQTNAYQANHNLLLSHTAKAETIPMLEILADDVQCKHGASIGPIDDEQAFYLMSRGVPKEMAQRLIVMGFVEPIIQQVPFEPLQQRLREEIEGTLHNS